MHSSDADVTTVGKQMLGRCLLVALVFVGTFGAVNLMFGFTLLAEVELIMVATLAALIVWNRFDGPLAILKNLFILHPVILFAALFFAGGMSGIGFIWSFGIPFIACMVAGTRAGLIWSLLYAALIAAVSFFSPDFDWLKLLYIGLAYVPFTMIALFTAQSMERVARLKDELLDDTTRLLKHEKHVLSENRGNHRAMLDVMPHAIAVHRDGRWIYCNPAGARLLAADGAEDVIGTSVFDYIHPDDHKQVSDRIRHMSETGRPAPVEEIRLIRRDGDEITVKLQGGPVVVDGKPAFLVTAEDTSERRQLDQEHNELKAQLEHAQRLESLGVLAGGIAHDFNNLLAAIMGNAELARDMIGGESPADPYIENIVGTCDHASELCKQMLAYAGKGSYELEVLDINEMVRSMGKLIRASVGDNIVLKIKLDPRLPGVEGDLAQIQQLILNFIVNSADAIGTETGEIKLSSGARYMQREALDKLYHGAELPEGEYVVIEVRDNGIGMDPATQTKIFDPFYTTKETGSGLGLSAVLGIVQGHHGAIQLFSAPGKGTAFRVYLPSTEQSVKEQMVTTVEVEAWRGAGSVLVVDDDLRVRSVAASFVEKLDFDVLTADDGREGVEQFRKHHDHLKAVLLDMTMPVMGGAEAMLGMREIDKTVPIILVSGYSEVEAGKLIAGDRPDGFLQKPFKAKALKSVLYEVMH
ncbi:ATP-binding protein [Mariprofundus ferrooxydans]|nr:ATP-binding protein [Mariprofundus ferrooxydans]